jgi:hypothetical protein
MINAYFPAMDLPPLKFQYLPTHHKSTDCAADSSTESPADGLVEIKAK